jgi:hypothetical protein
VRTNTRMMPGYDVGRHPELVGPERDQGIDLGGPTWANERRDRPRQEPDRGQAEHDTTANSGRSPRIPESQLGSRSDGLAQLPPTLRGVRVRGTKPRVVVVFQGWCVWGFGARVGAEAASSDGRAAASAAALARAVPACTPSFARQQCLYLRPEPQ